jgi:hypothetical protein
MTNFKSNSFEQYIIKNILLIFPVSDIISIIKLEQIKDVLFYSMFRAYLFNKYIALMRCDTFISEINSTKAFA